MLLKMVETIETNISDFYVQVVSIVIYCPVESSRYDHMISYVNE